MTLSMTRPQKHPDSGYYWFRKRVPDDLRDLVGKREERFSLGTRDPSEAKRLHALRLAEVEERWANLRIGQRPLSQDDIARLASEIGEQLRRQLEADPYQPLRWDVETGARLWSDSDTQGIYTDVTQPLSLTDRKRLDQRNICYALVDERLSGRGVATHPEDRERLARAASLEVQRIIQNHEAYLLGKQEAPAGGWEPSKPRMPATPLTFETVILGWLAEKKPNEKTEYTWRRVMTELSEFAGHDDARRVSADDLVSWKADLLAKGRAAKTIRDSKLAPVRAIFQWAVDNRKLDTNPAARINIDLKSRSAEKRRGYTDEEAKIVLRAARTSDEVHKRWVPWVCAYTGARIAEICQLDMIAGCPVVTPAMSDEAVVGHVIELQRLANRTGPTPRLEVAPVRIPQGDDSGSKPRARRLHGEIVRRRRVEGPKTVRDPSYLTINNVARLINGASVAVSQYGTRFNVRISIRHGVFGCKTQDEAADHFALFSKGLDSRLKNWTGAGHRLSVQEVNDVDGFCGRIVAFVPDVRLLQRWAARWHREDRIVGQEDTAIVIDVDPIDNGLEAHWRCVRWLCGGLNPAEPDYVSLRIETEFQRVAGNIGTRTRMPISDSLKPGEIERIGNKLGLHFVSAFDDRAYERLYQGWELTEHLDRVRHEREREAALARLRARYEPIDSIEQQSSLDAEIAELRASWPNELQRSRSWTLWAPK